MNDYIYLNGNKIELTEAQIAKIKESFGVTSRKLKDISEGECFEVAGCKFILLEHTEDGCVSLLWNNLGSSSFGDTNCYNGSRVDKVCSEFGKKIASRIGEKNLVEFSLSLTAEDGMDCYGEIKRKAALRTTEMHRKYACLLEKAGFPKIWEWTATPCSTPIHGCPHYVRCVSGDGALYCNSYNYSSGVRPFVIFNPSIFVY